MTVLVYLALALVTASLVGALFLAPACSLGFRPMLSGYTIVIYTMILYIALSAAIPIFFNDMVSLFYPSYSGPARFFGTLMINWLGIVLFVFFYQFFSHRRRQLLVQPVFRPERALFPASGYLFVVVGVVMKILFIMRAGGLHTLLITRSQGIARNLGLSQELDPTVLYLSYFSFIADSAACWLVLEAARARKQVLFHGIIVVCTLMLTLVISPKREVLIVPVLSLIVGFSIYYSPLRLTQAPLFLFGAVTFSFATLLGRIILPAYAAGITLFSWSRLDLVRKFAIRLLSADTAFFDATTVAIYGRELIFAKFGDWWSAFYRPNIEPFFYAVPRFIWPGKPASLVDVSGALQAILLGLPLERTIGGFGIGLIGTSWFYGEFVGLVVGMMLLATAAMLVDRFLAKMHYASPGRILVFATCATTLFHFYRQGTLGWVFLNFFQTSAVFLLTAATLTYLAGVMQDRTGESVLVPS